MHEQQDTVMVEGHDAAAYAARMERVIRHIEDNLDASLNLDTLAAVANFSKFHFHRQFSALQGLPVTRYVQLLRLKRAAWQLGFRKERRVLDIALEAGFDSAEAFSRSFRRSCGQSPSQFRASPDWKRLEAILEPLKKSRESHGVKQMNDFKNARMDRNVRIVDFPETRVARLAHRGDPAGLMETLGRFIAWRKANGPSPLKSRTFNIVYHDPESTPADDYRFDICASCDSEIADNAAGVVADVIPGGRCAVLRHTGSDENLRASMEYLYGEWLPASGEVLRDYPIFLERLTVYPDVAEHEMQTDIHLPLR